MAEDGPKRRVGRPPGKSDTERVTFTLPKDHFAYLRYLVAEKRRLGNSVNEAARHILIRELDAMLRGDYHKQGFE